METKEIEVKGQKIIVPTKENQKVRAISTTYTLQRFKNTLETLAKAKMLKEEEKQALSKLYNTIYQREIGGELNL